MHEEVSSCEEEALICQVLDCTEIYLHMHICIQRHPIWARGGEQCINSWSHYGPGGFPAGIRANTRDWAMIQGRLTLNLTADHIVKHNVKHIEHWSALKMQTIINIVKKGTGYPFLAFSIITQNQEKWNWLVHTVKKEAAIVCIRRVQYKSNMYPNYPQFGHILHIKTTYGLMTMLYETELVGIL